MNKAFKFAPLLLLLVLSASCQKKLHTIKISCMRPYCGGARPTPEIIADAEKIKPYNNEKIIIVSAHGKADSAVTDANGVLTKKLAPGNYTLFLPWQFYKQSPNGQPVSYFDKTCLEKEWANPIMKVEVTKTSLKQVSDSPIMIKCDYNPPCILDKYRGPMPE